MRPNKVKRKLRRPIAGIDTTNADIAVGKRVARAARALTPKAERSDDTKQTFLLRTDEIRQQAAIDYITDPESRTVEFWHQHPERPYSRLVVLPTFKDWGSEDRWVDRRETFWRQIEDRVLEHKQHQILLQRLKEIDLLTEGTDALREWLLPSRGDDGQIKRYPKLDDNGKAHRFAGLPMFPLELPSYDKFVKAYVDLDELLMLKRGEATSRKESMPAHTDPKTGRTITALDPVAQKIPFSKSDIRKLAKFTLMLRQPELAETFDLDATTEEEEGHE